MYCPTDEQLADFMTKPLDVVKFQQFRDVVLSALGRRVIVLLFGSLVLLCIALFVCVC